MKRMKQKRRNINLIFAAVMAAAGLASCATTMQSGIYTYDYERVTSSVDVQALYRAYGIEGGLSMEKKAEGAAVLVEGRQFTDPETGIRIEIGSDGSVSSPENGTIQGAYKKDGSLSFFGFYEENGQTIQISLKGKLMRSEPGARAGSEFDGEYRVTDSGTGRSQIVTVSDGLYLWEYEDTEDGDFEPWPTVVRPDGTFTGSFELTTHAVLGTFSEQTFFTKHQTEGKLQSGGGIRIQTLTVTNGTDAIETQEPLTFEGVCASTEARSIQTDKIRTAFSGEKRRKTAAAAPKEIPAPKWYSERLSVEPDRFVSCGMKTGGDRETAFKIAESIAAGKIASYIALDVHTATDVELKATEAASERRLYKTVSTVSQRQIPYTVTEQFYSEEHGAAFVKIESARN